MNTDECLKIVQGFKIGRMVGASELNAIKALLEQVERLNSDNDKLQSMVTLWIERACAIQPECTEQEHYALPHIDEVALNQQLCNLTIRPLGHAGPSLQMTAEASTPSPYILSSPPKV